MRHFRPSHFLARTFTILFWSLVLLPRVFAADDYTAPAVSVTSHANGATVNTKTITLSGTATDSGRGNSGISGVYARGLAPGSTIAGAGTVNWSQPITLNQGANSIEVTAYDDSPQRNFGTLTIVINFQPLDTLPPSLNVTSHGNGAIVNTKTITLSGTASDAGRGNNGISGVYARGLVAGSTTTGAGTVNWSQTITLNRGANYIDVSAYDNSDVQNAQTVSLVINFEPVDGLAPVLTIASHVNGQTVGTSTITLQGTASDAGRGNSGISSVYIQGYLPNTSTAGGGTVNWSKSVDLRPGANYISVYAYDNSDVLNEAREDFTINFQPSDTLAPVLTITSHVNGQTVTASTILLQGTATDAGRGDNGISSVYLRGYIPDTSVAGAGVVQWSRTVDLQPGANSIPVYAYDANQFPNEASQTIVINFQPADTLPPVLTVTSHTDGQHLTSSEITLTGTASDAGRGNNGISLVSVRGKIPDATATGAGVVNWSQQITLQPGLNTIYMYADDNAPFPNEASQTLTLYFTPSDTLPPNLAITTPADNQTVGSNTILVTGTASDSGQGNSGISEVDVNFVKLAGATATGAATVNWSKLVVLRPGRNTIYVSATDNAPFPVSTNTSITIVYSTADTLPPFISIDSHHNNQVVTSPIITLSGSASDAGQGDNGVKFVTVNTLATTGGVATGAAAANWSKAITLKPGDNVISVVAEDSLGNSGAATITINYTPEDTLPALQILSHNNNLTVSTSSITLSGTATDNGLGGSGIASVKINGSDATGGTAIGSATANWAGVLNLNLGANVISVVALDNAQNSAAISITINYEPNDTTPPALEITSHRKDQVVLKNTITLAGTATDARLGDNGIASLTVNGVQAVGGTAVGGGVANWSQNLTLNLGANVISVVARDTKSNTTAETLTIYYNPVDNAPPIIEITSHKEGQTVATPVLTLAGTATDANQGDNGISSVTVNEILAEGGGATGVETAHWSRTINLSLGRNVISVAALDNSPARNSAAKTIVIIYDPEVLQSSVGFCWATNAGGPGNDEGNAIAVDSQGNSYVTGSFEGTASFGATRLVSAGLADVFLAKWDPSGALLWARQAGGAKEDIGYGIALDASGNCYITGYYQDKARFDTVSLQNSSSFDLFLAKYDPSGNLLWATNTPDANTIYGHSIAVDANDNVFVTGSFFFDFNSADNILLNNDQSDIFVARFTSSGDLAWIMQAGGEKSDVGSGIAVDSTGNCYVTGSFEDFAFFEDQDLTASGVMDAFLAKYDADGNLVWVQQGGGTSETQAVSVKTDAANDCFVAGYFRHDTDFGASHLTSSGFFDLFLVKYDSSGKFLWAKNTETSSAINAVGLAVDPAGNSHITGSFFGPAIFDGNTYTNDDSSDIFVASFDPQGSFLWARTAASPAEMSGFAVGLDAAGNCYVTGIITGDATIGSNVLTSLGQDDLLLGKLSIGSSDSEPTLAYALLEDGSFQVSFNGEACYSYRLQSSPDLKEWVTVSLFDSPTQTVVYQDVDARTVPHRFYRVVSP